MADYNVDIGLDVNRVVLCGEVSDDPRPREGENWRLCTTNVLLRHVNERSGNEFRTFIAVIAFNRLSDKLAQVQKGQRIHIVGELGKRKWKTDNGEERWVTQVRISELYTESDFDLTPQNTISETPDDLW